MADFNQAFALTMGAEAGYANDPADRGGETYNGISRINFPRWSGWNVIDAYKADHPETFKALLAKDAKLGSYVKDFYKANFWDPIKLDNVAHQGISNELFDTGVNQGLGTAKQFLQEALNLCNNAGQLYPNLTVDGQIGPSTLACLAKANAGRVLNTLNLLQGERYLNIVRRNETQEKYWGGWLSRVLVSPPSSN